MDAIKTKHRLFRVYKRTGLQCDWLEFRTQRNKVSALLRRAKSDYVANLDSPQSLPNASAPNSATETFNPPHLHKLLRTLLKTKDTRIPDLTDNSGTTAQSDVAQ